MSNLTNSNGTLPENTYELYKYEPSLAAAIIFAVLFFATTAVHCVQTLKFRSWYWIPFIVGGVFEGIGFIARGISSQEEKYTLGPYIIQTLFILLAPALYAASIYMVLGRIIASLEAERLSLIRRTWMTKIFVGGDVLSFLLQSGGGGILASADGDPDKAKLGENIIIVGLFTQIVFFAFFIVVSILFHLRYARSGKFFPELHRRLLAFLYWTSLLIFVRSIFRTIEYIQGENGYLLSKEVFLYVFDAVLMFICMLAFNWCHPGSVLGDGKKSPLATANSSYDLETRANYGPNGYMTTDASSENTTRRY